VKQFHGGGQGLNWAVEPKEKEKRKVMPLKVTLMHKSKIPTFSNVI
jgi:hypothetical protein